MAIAVAFIFLKIVGRQGSKKPEETVPQARCAREETTRIELTLTSS